MHSYRRLISSQLSGLMLCLLTFSLLSCAGSPTVKVLDINDRDLIVAAKNGQLATVKIMLYKGADVNVRSRKGGWTPLIRSSQYGHVSVVKSLFTYAVKIDVANAVGETALMHAARKGHREIVSFLLERGADINSIDSSGRSALIYTAESGHAMIIVDLLNAGADINHVGKDNWSALAVAVLNGNTTAVKVLVEQGADVNIKMFGVADQAMTIVDWAQRNRYQHIAQLLRDAGAR